MKRETPLYGLIMQAVSKIGGRAFRNNSGLLYTHDGRPCRVGLGVGSADLIGWIPHVITERDIGRVVAVFTAIEVKSDRGKATEEQERFLERVRASGGVACLAKSIEQVLTTIRKFRGDL